MNVIEIIILTTFCHLWLYQDFFFQTLISYCKFINAKTLKYGMLHLCTLIFIKFFKNIKTPLSLVLLGLGFVSHQLVLTVLAIR